MKSLSIKAKIYLALQIIFTILTFVGFVLLFIGKIDNAGMSICCMVISLIFGVYYKDSTKNK
jgi:hypothetical protein